MSRQYHGTIAGIAGSTWLVELWNGATPATPDASVEVKLNGCTIDYQGENDQLYENPLKASRATVGFTSVRVSSGQYDSGVKAGLIGIALDEENKWVMKISKNGSFYWAGQVVFDQANYDYEGIPEWQINIVAVDCLSLIEGFEVDSSWFSLSSGQRETMIVLIASILNKTGLLAYFGSDVFGDGIQTQNANFPPAKYTLAYTTVNKYSFIENYEERSDKIKYLNCKQALENILNTFRPVQMLLCNGIYYITQPNAYASSTFTVDYYSYTGAINSSSSFTDFMVMAPTPTARPVMEAIPMGEYHKPVREVEIDWVKSNIQVAERTTASSALLSNTFTNFTTGTTVPGHLLKGTFKLHFGTYSFTTRYKVKTVICATNAGNYYWWDGNGNTWRNNGTSLTNLYQYSDWIYDVGEYDFISSYEIAEPPSGYSIYMDCIVYAQVGTVSPWGGGLLWTTFASTATPFTGVMTLQQAYNTASPIDYKQDRQYKNTLGSPRNLNATKLQLESKYYDGYSRDIGGLQVNNGSTYVDPGNWSVSFHSETGEINKISCTSITGLYSNFLQGINGTLHDAGNYFPSKSLSFDSYFWVFNGGKHDLYNDSFNATWLAVGTNYTLHSSSGEGEYLQLKKARDFEKKVDVLTDQMTVVHKQLGRITSALPVEIINNSPSAPVADPGVDKTYFVQLKYGYDATFPTLTWDITEGSAGGATNLSYIAAPLIGTVTSDTGTDATITAADVTNAGLLLPADYSKLQALDTAAYKSESYFIALSIVL